MMFPKLIRPKRPKWSRRDPVTPELRERVLARDKVCVAIVTGHPHECRDRLGIPHDFRETAKLTLEHVHDDYGLMGRRAPSDMAHVIAVCSAINLMPPTKEMRANFRAYLAASLVWGRVVE